MNLTQPVRESRDRHRGALLLLLAVALAVRLWGIGDRLPDPDVGVDPMTGDTAVDEGDRRASMYAWGMWRGGVGPFDPNPKTGDWPGLAFYVTLGLQILYGVGYRVAHPGLPAGEWARHTEADPASMFLFARLFGALLGVLAVYLTYTLGRRVAGNQAGVIAALLLALNPAHILASQRVSDPNLLALLFLLLALLFLTRAPDWRSVVGAGSMIGLAGASKYVPLAAAILIPFALWDGGDREDREGPGGQGGGGGRPSRRPGFPWGLLGLGLAACLGAFFIASPYTLLDWSTKLRDLELQSGRLRGEWVGISDSAISLPTYLVSTLPRMLGWPAYLLAIMGTVLLWRSHPHGRPVALLPVALLLPTGLLSMAQERFMLPSLAFLDIAAACAVVRLAAWAMGRLPSVRVPRKGRAALKPAPRKSWAALAPVALATSLCVAWPAPELLRTRVALSLEDTRHAARRWIEASIPASEIMALDLYGAAFEWGKDRRLAVLWPFLATQAHLVQVAYDPLWLDGFRYYVTSSEVRDRFATSADRYPREAAFYRWIQENGRLVWSSGSVRASGPMIEARELPQGIGTRASRDSLWLTWAARPRYEDRLARWCRDVSTGFLLRNDCDHAEEWAARGLTVAGNQFRRELLETQSIALITLGRVQEGERSAEEGLREFPDSPLLHLYRAMALEALSRPRESLEEYRAALRLSPNPDAANLVRSQISRMEIKARSSRR